MQFNPDIVCVRKVFQIKFPINFYFVAASCSSNKLSFLDRILCKGMIIIKSVLKLTTSTANIDKLALSVLVYVIMNVMFMLIDLNCISDLVYRIITPSVSIGNLEVVFNEL